MADLDNQLLEFRIDLSSEEHNTQISVENNMSLDGQSNNTDSQLTYSDLEVIKPHTWEKLEEAEKLKKLQSKIDQEMSNFSNKNSSNKNATHLLSEQKKAEIVDSRSVFVGNIPFVTNEDELKTHFESCGIIKKVTILRTKFYGFSKGYAFIEFADKNTANKAMVMDNSLIRGRTIKVNRKIRKNKPWLRTTNPPTQHWVRPAYPCQFRPMAWSSQSSYYYGGYTPLYRPRGCYFTRGNAMHHP